MMFSIGHQSVDEIAVQRLIPDSVAITRHAINEQPLYLVLLDSSDDEIKVSINLQLLRRIVENMDIPRVNLLFQIEAEGLGIAQNLCRVLIQGDQQAAFTLFCSFQQRLHGEYRLAGARDAHDHGGGSVEDTPADQGIDWLAADERASRDGARLCQEATHLDLYAAEHLQPLAGRDTKRVLAGLVVLPPAFHDFQAAVDSPLAMFALQDDHGVREEFRHLQVAGLLLVSDGLVGEHRGQVLALQPFDELL